jgi:putative DNA primase/helicase
MACDVTTAFVDAMKSAGIVPLEPIEERLTSGEAVYFRCDGDKLYQRKGWAVLHLDGYAAGAFGHFRMGISQHWRASSTFATTGKQRRQHAEQIRQEQARRKAELLARHTLAAASCAARWAAASATVDPLHPYLVRKGIIGEGLRQERDWLLVPMHDAQGRLWNLQAIDPSGRKLYSKGARLKGLHLMLGKVSDRVAIAEGYATAAVIRRATGFPVVVAFSWSNLVPTAQALRARFPYADIVIGADDDAHLVDHPQIRRNLGLEAASAAAAAVGGRLAVPPRRSQP